MALNPFILIPVVGIIAWAAEDSARKKRAKENKRRKYGVTFDDRCFSATIWDSDDARAYRDQIIVEALGDGIDDAETVFMRWLEEVSPSCYAQMVDGALTSDQAALYVRFWDSILDTMYDSGMIDDASFEIQSGYVWEFMDDFNLSEDEVNAAPIVVKG
jgi:hypothetical protein